MAIDFLGLADEDVCVFRHEMRFRGMKKKNLKKQSIKNKTRKGKRKILYTLDKVRILFVWIFSFFPAKAKGAEK